MHAPFVNTLIGRTAARVLPDLALVAQYGETETGSDSWRL